MACWTPFADLLPIESTLAGQPTLRKQASKARTRIVNAIKQILRRHDLQWEKPTKIFPTQKAIAWLKKLTLPKMDRMELGYLLRIGELGGVATHALGPSGFLGRVGVSAAVCEPIIAAISE